ncbi:MAG: MATE family efflux transporter [Erysipelotrichaceae bacterium]|nr:MATE family efflux transporter [Erysipelotrichaceae bacterium]
MSEKKVNSLDMTQGNIAAQIMKFVWPVLVASIFQQLYNMTNQFIVGNYVDEDTLSAVSACSAITSILIQMFAGLGLGVGVVVSNSFGARNNEKLKSAVRSSVLLSVIGGLLIVCISELLLPMMMKLININDVLYPIAEKYMRVYLLGSVCVLTYNVFFYIFRSIGDTRHPLYYLIVSSILNITLGIIFVRVMHLNVTGTALATIIAQLAVDILCFNLVQHNYLLKMDFSDFAIDWEVIKEVLRLGIPAGIQNTLVGFSGVVIQAYTNLFPNVVIAGIGVGQRVSSYAEMPMHAIQTAATSFVGQNYGAGEHERVRHGIRFCLMLCNVVALVLSTVIFIFAEPLVAMFNRNPDIVRYGSEMVRYTVYGTIFIGWSHIYNGSCRGAGNVREPLFIAVFSQFAIRYIFVTIAFKISFSLVNIYFAHVIGSVAAGILASLYFNLSKWTKDNHLRA